jgi:hypothetical protein
MITKTNLLIIALLATALTTKAQNILPAQRVDMMLEATTSTTATPSNDSTFASNAMVATKIMIVLQDTVHLAKIHVKLGTTATNYNLITKQFIYATTGIFTDGTSYTRNGFVVTLNLGSYLGLQNAYAEIKLEDTYARFTDPVNVSGN